MHNSDPELGGGGGVLIFWLNVMNPLECFYCIKGNVALDRYRRPGYNIFYGLFIT